MRNPTRALAVTASLSLLALASPGEAAAAPGVPETRLLANGLQVVTLEDHTLPLCAASLWVRSGSKDEIDSSAGYAHFLEHLIQRGGGAVGPFEYQRLANRWGGSLSVRANYDRTYITVTGVSSALEQVLGAVAGLGFGAALKDKEIDRELGALTGEIRNYYDEPSSVAFLESMRATFPSHPYRVPPLGNFKTLGALKHDALAAFYANLYVPNNMVLAVAGDIDPVRAGVLVDAAFGKAARSGTLPPRPPLPSAFPGHDDKEKLLAVKEPWTNLSFSAPGYRHPDRPAFEVIARALGDAGGAPLSAALLRAKAAEAARVTYYRLEDAGMLYVGIVPASKELSYAAAKAALEEIVAFKKRGLMEADLKLLTERLVRDERVRAESIAPRAESLGEAALFGGVRYYWDLPAAYAHLTVADIARVASTWLVGENLRLVVILPKDAAPPAEEQKKAFHDTLELLGHAVAGAAPGFERVAYPPEEAGKAAAAAWGDARDARGFKDPERTALANGVTLVVLEDHRHALAAVSLHLRVGSADEPSGKEGLANLAGHLITGGSTAAGRGEAVRLGDRLALLPEVQVQKDLTEVRFLLAPGDLKPALQTLSEALRRPLYTEAALKTVRAGLSSALERSAGDPSFAALELFRDRVYAGHPYARPTGGRPGTLAALTLDDVTAFRAAHLRPAGAVLAVAGDVDPSEVARQARDLFGSWKVEGSAAAQEAAGEHRPATAGAQPGEFTRTLTTAQSSVVVGVPGEAIDRPDFEGLRLLGSALTVLSFEDTVFKRRAAFSTSALPEGLRQGGSLSVQVIAAPPRLEEALFDVQRLMRRLALEDLSRKDLEDFGRFQAGKAAADTQGVLALASVLGYREAAGLGAATYRQAITPPVGWPPARLKDLAGRYLKPESSIVVKASPPSN